MTVLMMMMMNLKTVTNIDYSQANKRSIACISSTWRAGRLVVAELLDAVDINIIHLSDSWTSDFLLFFIENELF